MNEQTTTEAAPIDKKFLEVLEHHDDGQAITDVSRGLKAAVAAVQKTGKAAEVLLSIKVMPASRGKVSNLVVETKVKTKLPEVLPPGSIFFADGDYNLVREDPDQKKLDLKVVKPLVQDQPLKKVGAE